MERERRGRCWWHIKLRDGEGERAGGNILGGGEWRGVGFTKGTH